jgi:hypothetical protein
MAAALVDVSDWYIYTFWSIMKHFSVYISKFENKCMYTFLHVLLMYHKTLSSLHLPILPLDMGLWLTNNHFTCWKCYVGHPIFVLHKVYEGRIPSDRLVLRELTKEMISWPNLEVFTEPRIWNQ